jgi:uncharacterized protein (TIGR00369 family)
VTSIVDPSAGRGVSRFVGMDVVEVGDWEHGEVAVEGRVELGDHLRDPSGALRAGALLTMGDNIAGLCGGLAALPAGWVVTMNLMMRIASLTPVGDALFLRSDVVRRGRNAIVTSILARDDDGAVVATGTLTSAVLVPEGGPPAWSRPARLDHGVGVSAAALPGYYDWLGIDTQAVGDGSSAAMLRVFDDLRNPWGIVHGGVTAALVDVAAVAACDPTGRADMTTRDVVLHDLAPNRVGPIRADAQQLGSRPDGAIVRVTVHDEGADNRCSALAFVTVR